VSFPQPFQQVVPAEDEAYRHIIQTLAGVHSMP